MIFATNPITEDQYSKIKARWNNIFHIQKTWLAFLAFSVQSEQDWLFICALKSLLCSKEMTHKIFHYSSEQEMKGQSRLFKVNF